MRWFDFDKQMQAIGYAWIVAFVLFWVLLYHRSPFIVLPAAILVCYALVNSWIFYRVYLPKPNHIPRDVYSELIGLWLVAILVSCVVFGGVL